MENKLIYSSKINSSELLRSLAVNGVDSLGIDICNLNNLIVKANINTGFPITANVLNSNEILNRVLSFFLEKIDLKYVSYQDIQHFISTLNEVRYYYGGDNESKSLENVFNKFESDVSLQLFKKFYNEYISALGPDEDIFTFAHKLINYCKQNALKPFKILYYFEEDNLTPFELYALNSLSENVQGISVLSLFKNLKKSKISNIIPAYGERNEIAHVLKTIIENQYPLDECLIILSDKNSYAYELCRAKEEFNVSFTFETGVPITNMNVYKLYKILLQMNEIYFNDVNGYLSLFNSQLLDLDKLNVKHPIQLAQLLGRLKISFNKDENEIKILNFRRIQKDFSEEFNLIIEKIDRLIPDNKNEILNELYFVVDELSKGIGYFLKTYCLLNGKDEELEKLATEYLLGAFETAEELPSEIRESYLSTLGNKYLKREILNSNAIHVCEIPQGFSSFRKHTFFIGLNANLYPGDAKEDFLFSDEAYEILCGIKSISGLKTKQKNETLRKLIEIHLNLNEDVFLSYNSKQIKEVRDLNPCSVLLDYAEDFFDEDNKKKNKDEPDALTKKRLNCSYYDSDLLSMSTIANIAISNELITYQPLNILQTEIDNKTIKYLLEAKRYSPSKLVAFFNCPLKFYLDNIEYADEVITYDPLKPMAGNRFGDLFHYMFEHFVNLNGNIEKDELIKYGENLYNIYSIIDISIGNQDVEKRAFINAIEATYDFLTSNFVINGSKPEYCVDGDKSQINGLHFRGSIDLVTSDKNKNIIVVDYKTGMHIEHQENDLDSCIQGVVYCNLYALITGKKVSKMVFFYPRLAKTVVFDNPCSDEIIIELNNRVELIKEALKNKKFDIATKEKQDDGACKYCKYANICKKDLITEEELSDEE